MSVPRQRVSRIVDRWLDEMGLCSHRNANAPSIIAIGCGKPCPTLGKLTSSYEPRSSGSAICFEDRINADAYRELDTTRSWFLPDQWRLFEAVVRDGHPAGAAGALMADSTPSAIATAKAVVGMVACQIAARKGWG